MSLCLYRRKNGIGYYYVLLSKVCGAKKSLPTGLLACRQGLMFKDLCEKMNFSFRLSLSR